ncbi:MAG: bifunctional DNA-formamidopyrimidine glycosylase/DNA-(apurinic or apyrimidinic site) lyase [Rhodocyclaceae bacterium]
MPELPEVEISRRGLLAHLRGRVATCVVVRNAALRYPVSIDLAEQIVGRTLIDIGRRGKYLLLDFGNGQLLIHLGMSGSLRVVDPSVPPAKHDHVDIAFGSLAMRFHDPRRFGAMLWLGRNAAEHALLRGLGVEPLSDAFDVDYVYRATRQRRAAIKLVLMDSHAVVGIGNIYASESLFRAGIRPTRAAHRLTRSQSKRLVEAVRSTLQDALRAGGSSLRDFVASDGSPGHFQQQHFVYGRAGEPCRCCGALIRSLRQGQRSTFYCPTCQR